VVLPEDAVFVMFVKVNHIKENQQATQRYKINHVTQIQSICAQI